MKNHNATHSKLHQTVLRIYSKYKSIFYRNALMPLRIRCSPSASISFKNTCHTFCSHFETSKYKIVIVNHFPTLFEFVLPLLRNMGQEKKDEEVDSRRRNGDLGSLSSKAHNLKIGQHMVYQQVENGTGDRQTDSPAVTEDGRSQQRVRGRLELWSRCSITLIPAILSCSGE